MNVSVSVSVNVSVSVSVSMSMSVSECMSVGVNIKSESKSCAFRCQSLSVIRLFGFMFRWVLVIRFFQTNDTKHRYETKNQ